MSGETQRDDGGQMFPCPMGPDWPGCDRGVTLRDWFAGQALVGWLASTPEDALFHAGNTANSAYELADAMLRARKGTPS